MLAHPFVKAFLPLDGTSVDVSGNAHTVSNSGTPAYVTGKVSKGIELNAGTEKVNIVDAADLDNSQCTVAFWVYINSQTAWQVYACKGTPGGANFSNGWTWATCSPTINHLDSFRFCINNQANNASTLSSSITTGTWYHLMGTVDAANIKAFLNGELKATTAYASGVTANADNVVLNPAAAGYNTIDAVIDEFFYASKAVAECDGPRIQLGLHPLSI